MSNQFKGAYLGFKYGDTHSSELGIVRTSNGNRFDENLFPTIVDKALEIPGRDGKILQSTQYGPKNFSVPFAFDAMTEAEYQRLKQILGQKKIDKLVFDECPYKVRYAKITGSNTFKHLAFTEGGERVYKGEGTINFICYDPFAHCDALTDFDVLAQEYPEADEWMPNYIAPIVYSDGNKTIITIRNYGNMPADFVLSGSLIPGTESNKSNFDITLHDEAGVVLSEMHIKDLEVKKGDSYLELNSKLNLLEGRDDKGKKSGNVYDQHIESGSYFKIPVGISALQIVENSTGSWTNPKFKMDYLYF